MSESEAQEKTESATDLEQAIDQATEAATAQSQELDELTSKKSGEPMGLESLMGVPVKITVEVGRARMSLSELIEMGPGSVVELDRAAHEPADILVNGKVVARGEILTMGDSYGVRVTSVESS